MSTKKTRDQTAGALKKQLLWNVTYSIVLVLGLLAFLGIAIHGLLTKEDTTTYIALFAVACSGFSFLPFFLTAIKEAKKELSLRV